MCFHLCSIFSFPSTVDGTGNKQWRSQDSTIGWQYGERGSVSFYRFWDRPPAANAVFMIPIVIQWFRSTIKSGLLWWSFHLCKPWHVKFADTARKKIKFSCWLLDLTDIRSIYANRLNTGRLSPERRWCMFSHSQISQKHIISWFITKK